MICHIGCDDQQNQTTTMNRSTTRIQFNNFFLKFLTNTMKQQIEERRQRAEYVWLRKRNRTRLVRYIRHNENVHFAAPRASRNACAWNSREKQTISQHLTINEKIRTPSRSQPTHLIQQEWKSEFWQLQLLVTVVFKTACPIAAYISATDVRAGETRRYAETAVAAVLIRAFIAQAASILLQGDTTSQIRRGAWGSQGTCTGSPARCIFVEVYGVRGCFIDTDAVRVVGLATGTSGLAFPAANASGRLPLASSTFVDAFIAGLTFLNVDRAGRPTPFVDALPRFIWDVAVGERIGCSAACLHIELLVLLKRHA